MTTIAVVKKNGRAAIAADTLTKRGTGKEFASYIANNDKIVRAGDTFIGSGTDVALGAMYGIYDELKRSAKDIARFAIEAAEFDDATGLPVMSHSVKLKRR
jgi:ATP-dependent protease HslVU (ClpYQ) peptidase subunit